MKKRIIALLLALLMVIGTIPVPAFAADDGNATEETTQTICSVCNLADCTATHTQCEKCGNYDCTADHTNWCNTCNVDNCGIDHSAATEPSDAADSPCVTCGTVNCTADHTNWCNTCNVDNCGVDHGTAASTAVCEVCGNEVCTCEPIVDNCPYCEETTAEDGTVTHETTCNTNFEVDASADIGKTAAFSMVYVPALYSAEKPAAGFDYDLYDGDESYDFLEAEYNYDDPPLVEIADWYWDVSGAALWYRVKPLEGETLPEGITTESWVFQYHTDEDDSGVMETLIITSLDIIGKTVAFNEGSTNLYDGIEGNALAADTAILTTMVVKDLYTDGESTWYYVDAVEGETWPADYADYHHVAATDVTAVEAPSTPEIVGGKEVSDGAGIVTVKGSLPADATVEIKNVTDSAIMAELGIDNGFIMDIKLLDGDGNEWQPAAGETVTITIKAENPYTDIVHFLDNVDAINAGIANGTVDQVPVPAEVSAELKALLAPAITAWQSATGSTEEKVAVETITDITFDETNGTISFDTTGFSVYTGTEGTGEITGSVSMSTYNGETLYVTPNSTVTLTGRSKAGYFNSYDVSGHSWSTGQGTLSSPSEVNVTLTIGDLTPNTEFDVSDTYSYSSFGSTQTGTDTITFVIIPAVTFNGNGGTVDANNQAIYVKGAPAGTTFTLPTATRSGYYFDGWYTAPEGGTLVGVRDEGRSTTEHLVYDYTVTGNVTLYAHWSTKAEVSGYTNVIEIGLINAYYMNSQYDINGTSYPSLGQFPKEPSIVNHPAGSVYRVDDSNGYSLNLNGYYFLSGTPSDYIDESIMNSALLQTSYSSDGTTQGVADESGTLVRQFLKPGALDEKALIRAWLARLIDGNDSISEEVIRNIENTFGIDLPDQSANLTDEHISKFNIIPYVVKRHVGRYGAISTWIIDIIVAPANHYTLSYDMSPPAGYTSPVSGWDAIETHKAGTTATVHDGPPAGYKLTNEAGYTATFLYWTDEYGNKYGTGYDSDILMDSDKVLTAYWETNEKDPGSLKVTKKVTAVEGNQLPSDASTVPFTFTYSIDKSSLITGAVDSGSYSYTIYNAAGISQSNKTATALTGTFTLYDGWYIIMTNLPAGAKVTVKETVVSPYIPDPSELRMTIHAVQETSATFLNAYPLARYTVEHYLQNADGSYTFKEDEVLIGTVGELTEATANSYDGYTAVTPINQVKVLADDSAVVKIYYNLAPTTGNLTISKTVTGTGAPADAEFTFTVTFSDSTTKTVTLKADERTTLTNVPAGAFTVTENTPPTGFYAVSSTVTGTILAGETATAAFTNEYKPASLTVTKTVTGIETTQTFSFQVTFGDGSTQTFTLANGETKTFDNIPLGVYTVTEQAAGAGYATTFTGATGTAEAGKNYTAAFTNAYAPAKLTITKTVESAGSYTAPDTEFTFKVEFSDGKAYTYTKGDQSTQLASGGTLTLKHGERAVFENLPVGITYTVTEQTLPDYFTANQSSFTGTTTRGGVHTVAFVNIYKLPIVNYTVKYLEQGTNKVLASEKHGEGLVTATVTENAIDITNYTLAGDSSKSIVLKDAATENVIIFYYTRDVGGLTVTKNVALVGNATETVTDFYFDISVPAGVTGTYTYTVGTDSQSATVADGKMTIYIQNGQTATFDNLPIGEYTVAEHNYADKGYSASYVDNSDDTTDGVVTVTKGGTATVSCKNAFPVGSITITKTVSKENSGDAWNGDTFTFTITRTDETPLVDGTSYHVYEGTALLETKTVVNSTLTVEIAFTGEGTKTIKIDELPQGSYQVVESLSEDQAKAYNTEPSNRTQTTSISPDDYAGDASFTNTLKRYAGDLSIGKAVNVTSGTAPDTMFIFTVEPAQGVSFDKTSYTVVYTGTQSDTVTENVVDGKLTLELKANENVVIKGLPVGDYAVTEAPTLGFAPSFDGGNTVSSEVNATVPKDGRASVVCINRYPAYTGNLRIDKDVIKEYSRDTLPDHSFSITVTLTPDQNAVLVDRSYSYQIYDRNGNKVGDVVNGTIATGSTSATIAVGLKDGQYVVITDLPTGGYSVTENLGDLANDYNTPTYEAQTGMIEADQMAQATVKNKYKQHLGTLTITKTVNGGSADDTFIFHIKGTDTSNSYIDMDVTITGSDSVTVYDLPLGNYTVTEDTDWSWRYNQTDSNTTDNMITLNDLHANVTFTNARDTDMWLNYTANMPNVFGKKEDEQEGS